MKRRRQRGLTLVELIVAFTIMMLLTAMAVPLSRYKVRREKERELRWALRDVSMVIGPGEFVAIVGRNGAGKTTLAKHLNGLLIPAQGDVLVDGRPTRSLKPAELARSVGYVFQNPDHQIFAASVREELAMVVVQSGEQLPETL